MVQSNTNSKALIINETIIMYWSKNLKNAFGFTLK